MGRHQTPPQRHRVKRPGKETFPKPEDLSSKHSNRMRRGRQRDPAPPTAQIKGTPDAVLDGEHGPRPIPSFPQKGSSMWTQATGGLIHRKGDEARASSPLMA